MQQLGVENVISNPEKVMKFNILSTLEIIKFSKIQKDLKLCFASTSEVYNISKDNKLIPTEDNVPILLMVIWVLETHIYIKFYGNDDKI